LGAISFIDIGIQVFQDYVEYRNYMDISRQGLVTCRILHTMSEIKNGTFTKDWEGFPENVEISQYVGIKFHI
jgi:hypothetical protein